MRERTALVTGAAGGIGAAIVRRLHADGVRVRATDLQEAAALPREVDYRPLDLIRSDPAQLLGDLDGLDYLVSAAGVSMYDRDGSSLDIAEEVWETTLGVNFHALRKLTTVAVPFLRRGSGRSIVNIASVAGLRGMDSPQDAYQVSKAAVVSWSRAMALQLAPEGIRCNTVCPGAILTPMIAHLYEESPQRRRNMEERTPMRRLGTPEDVAGVVAFLLSDDAAFVTAADIVVDGGWVAQLK